MGSKKPKTSQDRSDLPKELQLYLEVLEGIAPLASLQKLLGEKVRWSRNGRSNVVDGRDVVCEQIKAWRETVEEVSVEVQKIQDYEDGCCKVDFVMTHDVDNASGGKTIVHLGVMAIYEIEGGEILEMGEFWQKVPPAAREYQ